MYLNFVSLQIENHITVLGEVSSKTLGTFLPKYKAH